MIVFDKSVNQDKYFRIIQYLKKSAKADEIITWHQRCATKVYVGQGIAGQSAWGNVYKEERKNGISKHSIYWNPFLGYEGPEGIQSPALAHAHELVHAYLHIIKAPIVAKSKMAKDKGQTEEQYIVVNYEAQMAKELGEPIRINYGDYSRVHVLNPIPPMLIVKRYKKDK